MYSDDELEYTDDEDSNYTDPDDDSLSDRLAPPRSGASSPFSSRPTAGSGANPFNTAGGAPASRGNTPFSSPAGANNPFNRAGGASPTSGGTGSTVFGRRSEDEPEDDEEETGRVSAPRMPGSAFARPGAGSPFGGSGSAPAGGKPDDERSPSSPPASGGSPSFVSRSTASNPFSSQRPSGDDKDKEKEDNPRQGSTGGGSPFGSPARPSTGSPFGASSGGNPAGGSSQFPPRPAQSGGGAAPTRSGDTGPLGASGSQGSAAPARTGGLPGSGGGQFSNRPATPGSGAGPLRTPPSEERDAPGGNRPAASGGGQPAGGSSGQPAGAGSPFGNRPAGGTPPGGSGQPAGAGSPFGSRPAGAGSPQSGSGTSGNRPPDAAKEQGDDKAQSGGNSPQNRPAGGGLFNRGGEKPDDKDKDKDAPKGNNPLGNLRSQFPLGGNKPADDKDKKDDKAKDGEKPSGGGGGLAGVGALAGGALGRVGNVFNRGGKPEDKAEDADKKENKPASGNDPAKPAAGGGAPFGAAGRLPFGGGAPSGGNAPSTNPAAASSSPSSGAPSRPFGASSPSSGGASAGTSAAGAGAKPAAGGTPSFGSRTATSAPAPSGKADPKADKPAPKGEKAATAAESGGRFAFLAGITASIPFLGQREAEKPSSQTVRQSRAPQVKQSEGLSLDRKLDILGAGLVLTALALFLSRLSSEQGVATKWINDLFAQVLGWGAWAVPLSMFAIGMWLLIRHFGDEAPTIDSERLLGVGIIYISLLVILQFVDSLSYVGVTKFSDLQIYARLSWEIPPYTGGGWIGANLYILLVQYLGESFALIVVIFTTVVGLMLLFDLSASEIAILTIGMYRSFRSAQRRSNEKKSVRRAVRLAKRQDQMTALAARNPAPALAIGVARPSLEALPAGQGLAALPEPDTDSPARAIPITMGGRTVTTSMNGEPAAVMVEAAPVAAGRPATPAPMAAPPEKRGGLFGGIAASLPFGNRTAKPEATNPTATPIAAAPRAAANPAPAAQGVAPAQTIAPAATAPTFAPAAVNNTPPATPTFAPTTATISAPTAATLNPTDSPLTANPPIGEAFTPARPVTSAGVVSPADAKVSPFGEAPLGRPAQPNFSPPSATDSAAPRVGQTAASVAAGLAGTRLSQTLSAAGDSTNAPAPANREDRLNALRQGITAHPTAAANPENTAAAPVSNSAPPVAVSPAPTPVSATVTPPASLDPTRTDAYGNAPTPPASLLRPDELKPIPGKVMSAAVVGTVPHEQRRTWRLPNMDELLNQGSEQDFDRQFLVDQARTIEDTLRSFGAPGRVVEINTGPVITQYGVEPDYLQGRSGKKNRVKVSAIAQLDRDLQLALGAKSIRVEAPVPGKGYVGIEIPNAENALVSLLDVMEAEQFVKLKQKSPLTIALGQSVDGTPVAADLAAMPHLLVAGTTGSGKSVCINAIISSLLVNNTPDDLKFIMVDPKRVELVGYNGIPHLVAPVVVDLERIVGVLKWVTREMDERYKRFSAAGARNIVDFNRHLASNDHKMPYIIVIIDELADLMMLAPEETERTISRIAALARATGIHLVIATQRPSVDVVTGLIKANFPARIAFAVAGSVDSRVIIDQPGAERLLGRGDMLYVSGNSPAPARLQGVYVSDEEIENITRFWKVQSSGAAPAPARGMAPMTLDPINAPPIMTPSGVAALANAPFGEGRNPNPQQQAFWDAPNAGAGDDADENDAPDDELYEQAVEWVRKLNKASVSLLQRRLRIGYTRASRLIDLLEERGVIGEQESGSKPREVFPE